MSHEHEKTHAMELAGLQEIAAADRAALEKSRVASAAAAAARQGRRASLAAQLSGIQGEEASELAAAIRLATYGHVADHRKVIAALKELGVRFTHEDENG